MRSTSRLATVIWWPNLRRMTSAHDSDARMRSRMAAMLAPILAMCSANCADVILLRSAMPLTTRSTSSSPVDDADSSWPPAASGAHRSARRAPACAPVGTYSFSICDLRLLTNSPCNCLTRACCSASDLRRIGLQPLHGEGLELLVHARRLELRLQLALHVGRAQHRQRHALLDLVAGDRLVVDEGDDRLDRPARRLVLRRLGGLRALLGALGRS